MQEDTHYGRKAIEKPDPYTRVPNNLIRNKELSCEARMFIIWATSHDSSFVWTRKHAMDALRIKSLTTFYRLIEELEKAKYLNRATVINSLTKPASEMYLIFKVPTNSDEYKELYYDSEDITNKEVGVPKNGTTPVPKFDTTPVPKNGTLKNNNLEEQREYNIYVPEDKKVKAPKKQFIPPTLDEVKAFVKEKGYKEELAIKAYSYYTDGNWRDKNDKPVLNWKLKLNMWFKDEYRITPQNDMVKVSTPFGDRLIVTREEYEKTKATTGFYKLID